MSAEAVELTDRGDPFKDQARRRELGGDWYFMAGPGRWTSWAHRDKEGRQLWTKEEHWGDQAWLSSVWEAGELMAATAGQGRAIKKEKGRL